MTPLTDSCAWLRSLHKSRFSSFFGKFLTRNSEPSGGFVCNIIILLTQRSDALYQELRSNYAALQKSLDQSLLTNQSGNVNISKLVDEINSSNNYIKQLVAAKSKSDSLLMVLSTNLTRSLDSSELKDVDVKVLKGVVYISLAVSSTVVPRLS